MDRAEVLARLDFERQLVVPSGVVAERLPYLTRVRSLDGGWAGVLWSCLTSEDVDSAIRDEIRHHQNLGQAFEWKVYGHDQPSDLLTRLAAAGFEMGPLEAVMVIAPDDYFSDGNLGLEAQGTHRLEADATVREISSDEDMTEYARVSESVFGSSHPGAAGEMEACLRSGSTDALGYLAYVDGVAVGAGRMYTNRESWFAGLYGGGTVAEFRGRGVYRALIAARARRARELGSRYLLVDALPTSRPILERLGFEHLTDTWACEWSPAKS